MPTKEKSLTDLVEELTENFSYSAIVSCLSEQAEDDDFMKISEILTKSANSISATGEDEDEGEGADDKEDDKETDNEETEDELETTQTA